jgi:hypothetical protein
MLPPPSTDLRPQISRQPDGRQSIATGAMTGGRFARYHVNFFIDVGLPLLRHPGLGLSGHHGIRGRLAGPHQAMLATAATRWNSSRAPRDVHPAQLANRQRVSRGFLHHPGHHSLTRFRKSGYHCSAVYGGEGWGRRIATAAGCCVHGVCCARPNKPWTIAGVSSRARAQR